MNDTHYRALVWPLLLGVAFSKLGNVPIANATTPNRQSWVHQAGTCLPTLEGTVVGRIDESCGDTDISVNTTQSYGHTRIRDAASPATYERSRTTGLCYHMCYQVIDRSGRFFIGYTVSPGGFHWTRLPGPGTNGSVTGRDPTDTFDAQTATSTTFTTDADTLTLLCFNEGSGHITTDRSSNNRTLTLGRPPNANTNNPLGVTSTAPSVP
ncbi:MAG: hypothetical protein KatS3mg054_0273 [Chloroflexus sp.]|nr:MAG: hypothetical protein KatS3mg054_0273 [Chloroflexus sp.]